MKMLLTVPVLLALVASVAAIPAIIEARATNTNLQTVFPASTSSTAIAAAKTIAAGESFDGAMKKWDRSSTLLFLKHLLLLCRILYNYRHGGLTHSLNKADPVHLHSEYLQ